MLQITFNGYEAPGIMRAALAALKCYVDAATQEYFDRVAQQDQQYGANSQTAQGHTHNVQTQGDMFAGMHAHGVSIDPAHGHSVSDPGPSAASTQVVSNVADEVLPAEKPTKGRKKERAPAVEEVKPEAAETATADQSEVIAQATAETAAKEVNVADIRAYAAKFNTDALREIAIAILRQHEVASVSELEKRDNIVRVSALRAFQKAAEEQNLS